MIRFSANLGYLWTDRPLPSAIRAAAAAGFDAVECHMPYGSDPAAVRTALDETGLPMVSLNTRFGSRPGDFGTAALPDRETEARTAIAEALDFAAAIDCPNVSVLAGRSGRTPRAQDTYQSNLAYAAERAEQTGRSVLIEPLSTHVAEDYHLMSVDVAVRTIEAVGAANIRVMVDCFHSRMMEGDLQAVFHRVGRHLGHVQISSFPDRGEPDGDDPNYAELLPQLVEDGWIGPFGAEYTPRAGLDAGLGWLSYWHARRKEQT